MDPLVRADGLGKSFGPVAAVSELSFAIAPGEVVGLLGPNGAGKTTTLKLLLGLLRPSAGSASVLGLDCTEAARAVKSRLGYCPDEPAFHTFLTGRETLAFVCAVRGIDPVASVAALTPLIDVLDFGPQLDVYTANYSHGMKKKLALLAALVHDPRVLLLDEPTNGLDPPTAHRVRELLLGKARAGAAILVSTHLLDMADRLCDRVLVLHKGRLVAEGTPADVRARAGLPPESSLEDAFLRLVA
ncbi:MAG: ABC transporter ATP-binding protein [Deltaproteobacteria bacterium]|nr:ABC transporter ATP-binding protein [Deltaproteobacteria bacterium]